MCIYIYIYIYILYTIYRTREREREGEGDCKDTVRWCHRALAYRDSHYQHYSCCAETSRRSVKVVPRKGAGHSSRRPASGRPKPQGPEPLLITGKPSTSDLRTSKWGARILETYAFRRSKSQEAEPDFPIAF